MSRKLAEMVTENESLIECLGMHISKVGGNSLKGNRGRSKG